MGLFVKIVHGFKRLTIFIKSFILDVELGSKYCSADSNPLLIFSKNEQFTNFLVKLLLASSCYVTWNLFTIGSLQFCNDRTMASLEGNQNRPK